MEPPEIRDQLKKSGPTVWDQLSRLAERWTAPIVERIGSQHGYDGFPKTFNDPIWGTVELYPWEVKLLDSPLLQRLRGVRQLGMAHLVYAGASHDRLEHSIGVVEAAARIIRSLSHNATNRRRFGTGADEAIPVPGDFDLDVISARLGALLHDIGHTPFSHATEALIADRCADELRRMEAAVRRTFQGVTKIAPAEMIAVVIILSEPMRQVFEHPRFGATATPSELAPAVAARVLGSRSWLKAEYLSGVVSGPIDADKLDYMARDSHHSGLKLGLDVHRLISKLEVVTITPDNAPSPELRARAAAAPEQRLYDVGISLAGLGAYEQMIFGRVFLYDRIYFHHKVRAAEAMIRRLVLTVEDAAGKKFELSDLYHDGSDDSFISAVNATAGHGEGSERIGRLAGAIRRRDIFARAFAFAARYLAGLDGLPRDELEDTRALLWARIQSGLQTEEGRRSLAREVFLKARQIALAAGAGDRTSGFQEEHILVDVPPAKTVVYKADLLTRSHAGHLGTPNLYFNAERWSHAYENQKQCGFVFTPREFVPFVAAASRIVFFDRFDVVMKRAAEEAVKCVGVFPPDWLTLAGVCSAACREALSGQHTHLAVFRPDDIAVPDAWRLADPGLGVRLANELRETLPAGLPASVHAKVKGAVFHLSHFVDMAIKDGMFSAAKNLLEADFQAAVRQHLRSRGVACLDGAEFAGGETDLLLFGDLVVENKVAGDLAKPLDAGPHYGWQARRYSMALCSRISFVMLAYKPANERALLPAYQSIRVAPVGDSPDGHVQVRLVVPWGQPTPHDAKKPPDPVKAS